MSLPKAFALSLASSGSCTLNLTLRQEGECEINTELGLPPKQRKLTIQQSWRKRQVGRPVDCRWGERLWCSCSNREERECCEAPVLVATYGEGANLTCSNFFGLASSSCS